MTQPMTGNAMMMKIHQYGRPVFSAWYAKQNWIRTTIPPISGIRPPAFLPPPGLLLQPEHVLHIVQPGLLSLEELCRTQRAVRVREAALRTHRNFDALAGTSEDHG